MQELKPCPFCGGTDIRSERSERVSKSGKLIRYMSTRYRYFCAACFCGTSPQYDMESAREVWNRRPDDEAGD